jgi:hypothetical protein
MPEKAQNAANDRRKKAERFRDYVKLRKPPL